MKVKFLCWLGVLSAIAAPLATVAAPPPLSRPSVPAMELALEFPPGPNRGSPESTAGGGTRGESDDFRTAKTTCSESASRLTALLPVGYDALKTASPNPTFFLYVPKTEAKTAEFTVVDSRGGDVYVDTFAIPGDGGIVRIELPETVSLEVGQTYIWQFSMLCDPNQRASDESVQGAIERVELDSERQTQIEAETDPLERAQLYAEKQIWPETVAIALELRETNPEVWEQLMESVELTDIASEPMAPCCGTETRETVSSEDNES
ncbi:DUF928 domain-containing protein [Lyngbya sp. CCY1209]|uniref:DUF928 domain-containing protein n=1 Tax=Lyngbya sp. CCY1209 TaxID=2886103 RepID=UPI002D200B72|nr:DUF928 domain-containing protein [Lyngbya sp. CCY1209]MEB3884966.1 DUF928 domain-containing protein [Lyngbya sp. CCY1209]